MLMQRAVLAAAAASSRSVGRRVGHRSGPLASLVSNYRQVCWMSTAPDVDIPPPPTSHHAHTKLPNAQGSIIYTETDEAPALATYSLFPVVNKIGALAGIDIIPCDVS